MKLKAVEQVFFEMKDPLFTEKEVTLHVLRLDQVHPYISGNKWYKLKYNVEEFLRQEKEFMVTFGGAYSNHIIAVAAAAEELGFKCAGIIRGDELNENSNPALKFAARSGMKLFFVSRNNYRQIRETGNLPAAFYGDLRIEPQDVFLIPEGGSNAHAVRGCAEIISSIPAEFDFISCPCGTGTTLAGFTSSLNSTRQGIGFAVLQGENFLEADILQLNGGRKNFKVVHDYSFGGYARSTRELQSFCDDFFLKHHFVAEPVYTGKMFFGLYDLIGKNYFRKGSRIIAVHTGGVIDFGEAGMGTLQ